MVGNAQQLQPPANDRADEARLLIILATYNERDNLPTLVEALFRLLPDAELLVIDDGSRDGTASWSRSYQAAHPKFHLIERPHERGLGSAARLGLQFGLDRGFDLIATLDADWSHDPADLARLVTEAQRAPQSARCEVWIGSRYVAGGQIVDWNWLRRAASRRINYWGRRRLQLPVADISSAMRVYSAAALHRIPLNQLQANSFAYLEEILVALHRAGVPLFECPIAFRPRRSGRSKLSWADAWDVLRLIVKGSRG